MHKLTVIFVCIGSSAFGQSVDLESMELATNLGTVLASEEFCDLQYDQAAISEFISQNVKASDLGFAPMLQGMTIGSEYQLSSMSESSKTAHCTAIMQTAKHFGFIN